MKKTAVFGGLLRTFNMPILTENKAKYWGVTLKQVSGVLETFDLFFKKEKFDQIIEIGTGNGAFTLFIANHASKMGASVITFDIKDPEPSIKEELKKLNVEVVKQDINENIEIEEKIKYDGRCLILNDGGLKVPQFVRFAKLIKPNDILLTHDYYKNRSPAKGIIIIDDVAEDIKDNILKVIYRSLFDSFLWLCVKKEKHKYLRRFNIIE